MAHIFQDHFPAQDLQIKGNQAIKYIPVCCVSGDVFYATYFKWMVSNLVGTVRVVGVYRWHAAALYFESTKKIK